MSETTNEAGKPATPGGATPDEVTAADPTATSEYEGRPRSYWGLRPRRGIRRTLMVLIALSLAGVIAWELVLLWRRAA